MEEAVVGSVIGATIQVVIQILLSIPTEEFNLVRDFKEDLKRLSNSFLMIQDFFYDAKMHQNTSKAVNPWLKKLQSVAFDVDNIFDELPYQDLRSKMETRNSMTKKVQIFFTYPNFRRKVARKSRDINEKLTLIDQQVTDFGLQTMKPVVTAGFDAVGWETDPYAADPIVLGREYDVSRIVEMLTTSSAQQVFSILPIVGMGGLGKTMTRQVFNHDRIKAHFDK